MKHSKLTLEYIDDFDETYDMYEVPREARILIFPDRYGVDTIITLAYYDEDNLQ